jgi:hypothetical protein
VRGERFGRWLVEATLIAVFVTLTVLFVAMVTERGCRAEEHEEPSWAEQRA